MITHNYALLCICVQHGLPFLWFFSFNSKDRTQLCEEGNCQIEAPSAFLHLLESELYHYVYDRRGM